MKPEELIDRYYDGEVDESESERVRELFASDAESRARFERLALIGSLVREAESRHRLPSDFTDRVMGRIAAEAPKARPKRAAAFATAAASALALAAAVALFVRTQPPSGSVSSAPRSQVTAPSTAPSFADASHVELDAEPPVAIESVDFGSTQGAIFLVSAGVTDTMVVWTLDDPAPPGSLR